MQRSHRLGVKLGKCCAWATLWVACAALLAAACQVSEQDFKKACLECLSLENCMFDRWNEKCVEDDGRRREERGVFFRLRYSTLRDGNDPWCDPEPQLSDLQNRKNLQNLASLPQRPPVNIEPPEQGATTIQVLPVEILVFIFSHIPSSDLGALNRVCSEFHELTTDKLGEYKSFVDAVEKLFAGDKQLKLSTHHVNEARSKFPVVFVGSETLLRGQLHVPVFHFAVHVPEILSGDGRYFYRGIESSLVDLFSKDHDAAEKYLKKWRNLFDAMHMPKGHLLAMSPSDANAGTVADALTTTKLHAKLSPDWDSSAKALLYVNKSGEVVAVMQLNSNDEATYDVFLVKSRLSDIVTAGMVCPK